MLMVGYPCLGTHAHALPPAMAQSATAFPIFHPTSTCEATTCNGSKPAYLLINGTISLMLADIASSNYFEKWHIHHSFGLVSFCPYLYDANVYAG